MNSLNLRFLCVFFNQFIQNSIIYTAVRHYCEYSFSIMLQDISSSDVSRGDVKGDKCSIQDNIHENVKRHVNAMVNLNILS